MHQWGDDIDWKGIEDCCDIIHDICTNYGRFGCHTKEKYGTVRAYVNFYLSLHSLIYPGYVYNQFPKWLLKLDLYMITPVLQKVFSRSMFWYQKKIYNYAYQKCLNKYPRLREEILCCADYPEFIK